MNWYVSHKYYIKVADEWVVGVGFVIVGIMLTTRYIYIYSRSPDGLYESIVR